MGLPPPPSLLSPVQPGSYLEGERGLSVPLPPTFDAIFAACWAYFVYAFFNTIAYPYDRDAEIALISDQPSKKYQKKTQPFFIFLKKSPYTT